jgi:phage baseplate assembly protein gpV
VPLLNQAAAYSWQASDLAQAEMDSRTASEICLWGRAVGNPELAPGAHVRLSEVEASLEGTYMVTSALHRINSPGEYTTEIDTYPPELPSRPRGDVATIGVVTHVDDPTRSGRVRAVLPAYDNVETGWMQVVIPGAGPGKGFISMPGAGDNVLVLLTREDPARGLVLGGLYGSQQSPDSGVERSAVERYTWITPGRQKIQLNDSGKVIRLENAAGSYIELAGDSITIAGNAIDFKRT